MRVSVNFGCYIVLFVYFSGKTWGVKTLLELQADTKQEFFYGKAVHAACAMDDAEALKALIESGSNVSWSSIYS